VNSNITEAVDKVRSAVVGVENIGFSDGNEEGAKQGTGSGIIFEKKNGKAHIVTNYHVIQGAREVRVNLPLDNKTKTVPAKVLGSDPVTDLAVLEINGEDVTTVAQFGNSDTLRPGEPAIAIGNPLGPQFSQSVTVGVISSTRRTIKVSANMETDVIQTDAAINPGNSGGALVNAAGQVIGINSLKIAQSGVEGLGFAIPSNDAIPIIQALIQHGRVPRPYLGVTLVDLQKLPSSIWGELKIPAGVESGVVIDSVDINTPASSAGLQEGDVIVALDDQPVNSSAEVRRYLYKNKEINSTVRVTFYRAGAKQTITVKLSDTPQ
jgi:serine protease Do